MSQEGARFRVEAILLVILTEYSRSLSINVISLFGGSEESSRTLILMNKLVKIMDESAEPSLGKERRLIGEKLYCP